MTEREKDQIIEDIMKISGLNTDKFQVKCRNNDCGISGKIYYDKEKAIENWNKRIYSWKTIDEEMPNIGEIILIKLSAETTYLCDYEKSNGIILACLYRCENDDLIFYGYPLDDSYKLNEIEKWMPIPEREEG